MNLDTALATLTDFVNRMEHLVDRLEQLNPDDDVLTLSTSEAASRLGVGDDLVRRWVNRGVLPRLPDCRDIRVPRKAVEAFVTEAAERAQAHRRAS